MTVKYEDFEIYRDVNAGETKASVARKYGVSPRTVGRAIKRVEDSVVDAALNHRNTSTTSVKDDRTHELISKTFGLTKKDVRLIIADATDCGVFDADPTIDVTTREDQVPDANVECTPKPELELEPEHYTFTVIGSAQSITVNRSDGETRSIEASNKLFANVYNIVKSGLDDETLARAFDEMSFSTVLERYSDGMLLIDPEDGRVVMYPDTPHEITFGNSLAEKLLRHCYEGIDNEEFSALSSFAKKLALANNPDVIAELFDFIAANDITIDEEGYVICWKRVQENYKDIYSGSFDNSPGAVCEIPAHTVDTNRHNTCSYGLHVCSKSYLPHFAHTADDRVVKVRVHPRDFIAIPSDYRNAKARVSRYVVLEDVTDQML